MSHGHVAVVAQVLSSRKLLVDHANWAPHRGHGRGEVTKMVVMTDVSPRNDWTEVRVWNAASDEMGQRVYPTYGFIYPRARDSQVQMAQVQMADAEMTGAEMADADAPPSVPPNVIDLSIAQFGVADLAAPTMLSSLLPGEPSFAQ